MNPREIRQQRVMDVARELRTAIRQQARGRWSEVRLADRNEPGRRVWRFRSGPGGAERFLHIEHGAMLRGENAAARLMEQLEAQRWLDRLEGAADALLLSANGQLAAFRA